VSEPERGCRLCFQSGGIALNIQIEGASTKATRTLVVANLTTCGFAPGKLLRRQKGLEQHPLNRSNHTVGRFRTSQHLRPCPVSRSVMQMLSFSKDSIHYEEKASPSSSSHRDLFAFAFAGAIGPTPFRIVAEDMAIDGLFAHPLQTGSPFPSIGQ